MSEVDRGIEMRVYSILHRHSTEVYASFSGMLQTEEFIKVVFTFPVETNAQCPH